VYARRVLLPFLLVISGCSFVGPGIYHRVGSGETLWNIAEAYGVDSDRLAEANRRISDPDRLREGDMVYIPGARRQADVAVARLSFIWPLQGEVFREFGRSGHRRSLGIGIKAREGEPVVASESGEVVFASDDFRMYGRTIIIDHGDEYATVYAHNSRILVEEGARVSRGEKIAEAGSSGRAESPGVYFEVRYREEPRNPMHFLP